MFHLSKIEVQRNTTKAHKKTMSLSEVKSVMSNLLYQSSGAKGEVRQKVGSHQKMNKMTNLRMKRRFKNQVPNHFSSQKLMNPNLCLYSSQHLKNWRHSQLLNLSPLKSKNLSLHLNRRATNTHWKLQLSKLEFF